MFGDVFVVRAALDEARVGLVTLQFRTNGPFD